MKRWITLLILIAFGLGLFASPLSAMERDPGKPLPWLMNENPSGDDTGWHEADRGYEVIIDRVNFYEDLFTSYLKVFVASKQVVTTKKSVSENAADNNGTVSPDRTASTR